METRERETTMITRATRQKKYECMLTPRTQRNMANTV